MNSGATRLEDSLLKALKPKNFPSGDSLQSIKGNSHAILQAFMLMVGLKDRSQLLLNRMRTSVLGSWSVEWETTVCSISIKTFCIKHPWSKKSLSSRLSALEARRSILLEGTKTSRKFSWSLVKSMISTRISGIWMTKYSWMWQGLRVAHLSSRIISFTFSVDITKRWEPWTPLRDTTST